MEQHLLWFGWFGFNAGSALTAGGLAGSAFLATNTAAAAGMISWVIIDYMKTGKPTMLGAISGAIAGLVAITPAAGFVTIPAAIIIGLITSVISYAAICLPKTKIRIRRCSGCIWNTRNVWSMGIHRRRSICRTIH